VIHHGDEQVQQHDNVDDAVAAEHEHAPEAREYLDAVQLEALEIDETERRPEERLRRLEQTAGT
jgi:hypothetical protein